MAAILKALQERPALALAAQDRDDTMPARTLDAPLRIATATVATFVLVQALGLQLLCLCGHCPRSEALGLVTRAAPAHACCHAATAAQPGPAADLSAVQDPCCDDAHAARAPLAVLERPHAEPQWLALAVVAMPAPALAFGPGSAALLPVVRSRGPPGPNQPIWLHDLAILV